MLRDSGLRQKQQKARKELERYARIKESREEGFLKMSNKKTDSWPQNSARVRDAKRLPEKPKILKSGKLKPYTLIIKKNPKANHGSSSFWASYGVGTIKEHYPTLKAAKQAETHKKADPFYSKYFDLETKIIDERMQKT